MVAEIREREGKGHGEIARVGRQLGIHPEAVRLDRGRSAPGGLLSPGPGTAVTAPLIAPVIPSGPAPYGWCQNKEG
jgi:hypothetical protein